VTHPRERACAAAMWSAGQPIKSCDFIPKDVTVFMPDDSWAFLVPADLEQVSQTVPKLGHCKI